MRIGGDGIEKEVMKWGRIEHAGGEKRPLLWQNTNVTRGTRLAARMCLVGGIFRV
jgi:hypothetical protein